MFLGEENVSKIYVGDSEVSKIYLGDTLVYGQNNYVTFTATVDNSSVGFSQLSTKQQMWYSRDGVEWYEFTTGNTQTLEYSGDSIYVRGILSDDPSYEEGDSTVFSMSGRIKSSGNCNALWNYENVNAPLKKYCGAALFMDCESLVQAPELPSTTLSEGCYFGMFGNCLNLRTAPSLPATELSYVCYYNMFMHCESLIAAPELPATILAQGCYFCMFKNCTSLTTAPETLPALVLAEHCYVSMFSNCTSLTTAPETLPATTLANGCYSGMFQGCTSLTTSPELPATTLVEGCYRNMFNNCSNINYIKCLAVNGIDTNNSTTSWVEGVSETGTFQKDPNAVWPIGINGIPSYWSDH